MFETAGKWIDGKFIGVRDWLDNRLVPSWRVWWKLTSMQLGIFFAAVTTLLLQFPTALERAIDAFPPWLKDSLPAWFGPFLLIVLFFGRFWDQTHITKAKQAAGDQPQQVQHGAE